MTKYNLIFITILTLVLANHISAQTPAKYKAALPNYEQALQSDNEAMIESAIENLILLKLSAPELDYTFAADKMKELAESGTKETIQYKAFIGQLYLNHPERFNWLEAENLEANITKFDQIFAKIELQHGQAQ